MPELWGQGGPAQRELHVQMSWGGKEASLFGGSVVVVVTGVHRVGEGGVSSKAGAVSSDQTLWVPARSLI